MDWTHWKIDVQQQNFISVCIFERKIWFLVENVESTDSQLTSQHLRTRHLDELYHSTSQYLLISPCSCFHFQLLYKERVKKKQKKFPSGGYPLFWDVLASLRTMLWVCWPMTFLRLSQFKADIASDCLFIFNKQCQHC